MSHVLQVIADAVLSTGSRPFASFDDLVRRATGLLSRLMCPRPSSLRVSQQWLDEHEAAAARHPRN